jgi:hypothetical protein
MDVSGRVQRSAVLDANLDSIVLGSANELLLAVRIFSSPAPCHAESRDTSDLPAPNPPIPESPTTHQAFPEELLDGLVWTPEAS